MRRLAITAYSLCSAAGDGRVATLRALRERRSGLQRNDFGAAPLATWIGRVARSRGAGVAAAARRMGLPQQPARLARAARGWVHRTRLRLPASATARDRVAVVVGTSTSSIGASEDAYRRLEPDGRYPPDLRRPIIHTPHSLGDFVQHALGLSGI